MIHHVSLGTADIARAQAFHDPVMATLGLTRIKVEAEAVHYGVSEILFSLIVPAAGAPSANGVHVAFVARDRATVDAFYAAALAHGGTDDGAPGTRPEYDANYYAAFVRDPDGNKIEAVTFSAS